MRTRKEAPAPRLLVVEDEDTIRDGEGSVVEPCISCLRRKVDQGRPRLIHTIRGVRYVLRIPPP